MKKNNELILFEIEKLKVKFPDKPELLEEKDAKNIQNAINKKGFYDSNGRCYLEKTAIRTIICTDSKGANRFYNDLEDNDKIENGKNHYVRIEAVQYEISKRSQEPRDIYVRERMKYAEDCIIDFRDSPQLSKMRSIEKSKIDKELPNIKKKKIKTEGLTCCELTGEPLEKNSAAHHMDRKSDVPRKALDEENIKIVNPGVHKTIHQAGAESKEELAELCKENGWIKVH